MKLQEIKSELNRLEQIFFDSSMRKNVDLTDTWVKGMTDEAGVYGWFDGDELVYVGESGCLSARLSDCRRTVNHTLRRNIGEVLFKNERGYEKATTKKKFPEHIERKVNDYMKTLSVRDMEVNFGRTEFEEYISAKYGPKFNKKRKREPKRKRR